MIEDDKIGNELLPKKRNSSVLKFICRKKKNDQTENSEEYFSEDNAKNIILQASFQDSYKFCEQEIVTQQLYMLFFCIGKIVYASSSAKLKYCPIILNFVIYL